VAKSNIASAQYSPHIWCFHNMGKNCSSCSGLVCNAASVKTVQGPNQMDSRPQLLWTIL